MGHDIDEPRIRALIEAVYGAALAPGDWPAVLERLASVFSGGFVDLFTRSHDGASVSGLAYGIDRSDDDHIVGFWFKHTVWGRTQPVRVADEVLSTRQMMDVAAPRGSQIFDEDLDPRGLHEVLRLSLWVGQHESQGISILRPWSAGAFGPAEVALGEVLLPHLQRAAAVARRLREADFKLDVGAGGAGTGGFAAFAFDGGGAPFWSNAAGETVLADGTVLSLQGGRVHDGEIQGGELQAGTPAATRALRRAVAAASGRAGTFVEGCTVQLPRPGAAPPLNLVVLPLSNPCDWATSRPPAAVAFLRDPAALALSRDRLRQVFPLTRAEADLAQHLLAGRSLRQVAERSGRSLNTVRSHLAHLMDKTETSRQGDLVRLLGDLATLGPPRSEATASRLNPPF